MRCFTPLLYSFIPMGSLKSKRLKNYDQGVLYQNYTELGFQMKLFLFLALKCNSCDLFVYHLTASGWYILVWIIHQKYVRRKKISNQVFWKCGTIGICCQFVCCRVMHRQTHSWSGNSVGVMNWMVNTVSMLKWMTCLFHPICYLLRQKKPWSSLSYVEKTPCFLLIAPTSFILFFNCSSCNLYCSISS